MKRDKKLVSEVVTLLRNSPSAWVTKSDLERAISDDPMPDGTLQYHLRIMREAGLVEIDGLKVALTWRGHDLAEESNASSGLVAWTKLGA